MDLNTVLPLTREWIEISSDIVMPKVSEVLPLTREWIEISSSILKSKSNPRSPSYEGVD